MRRPGSRFSQHDHPSMLLYCLPLIAQAAVAWPSTEAPAVPGPSALGTAAEDNRLACRSTVTNLWLHACMLQWNMHAAKKVRSSPAFLPPLRQEASM